MSSAVTFHFKDIIANYDDWQGFVSQLDIVNYNDAIQADFDKWLYDVISRHFNNQNIRYTTPDAFLCAFGNRYIERFKQLLQQKQAVEATQKLTLEDYLTLQENIQNFAQNPNDMPGDPTKPLDFVSNQNWGKISSNKLQSYLYALRNMPGINITDIINYFKDLFMCVQVNVDYIFWR